MFKRRAVGTRNHKATFFRHNGTTDVSGNPTYSVDADWEQLNQGWPCEMISGTAGETIRGRQVVAETTHLLYGDWAAVKFVEPTDRVQIGGVRFSITSVSDPGGDRMETRIEIKREVH